MFSVFKKKSFASYALVRLKNKRGADLSDDNYELLITNYLFSNYELPI